MALGTGNAGTGGGDTAQSRAVADRLVRTSDGGGNGDAMRVEDVSSSKGGGEEDCLWDGAHVANCDDIVDKEGECCSGGEYMLAEAEDFPSPTDGRAIQRRAPYPHPKGILGETRRGAGSGASPWKQVRFQRELPEGFPERTGRHHRRNQRSSELSGLSIVALLACCLCVFRVFQILTERVLSSVSDAPDGL